MALEPIQPIFVTVTLLGQWLVLGGRLPWLLGYFFGLCWAVTPLSGVWAAIAALVVPTRPETPAIMAPVTIQSRTGGRPA